jgi:uncharacterized protein (TIGR04255 family)
MYTSRHYLKPPITEAILDLRVTLPQGFSIDTLEEIHSQVRGNYPQKVPIFAGSIEYQADQNIVNTSRSQHGFQFKSENSPYIFQAALGGFTCNHIAPYSSWEQFRSEAKRLWGIYKDICKPISVTRIGLRYINRIEIPKLAIDFKDYLRVSPEIASDLPQGLSNFYMQLQIPQEELQCMLTINEAFIPPTTPTIIPVILDIDVFRVKDWDSNDNDIWRFIEQLRGLKNETFEKCITDETRRLFE